MSRPTRSELEEAAKRDQKTKAYFGSAGYPATARYALKLLDELDNRILERDGAAEAADRFKAERDAMKGVVEAAKEYRIAGEEFFKFSGRPACNEDEGKAYLFAFERVSAGKKALDDALSALTPERKGKRNE